MSKGILWGAKPKEWDTFLDQQLQEDLLPVVSNQGAEISSNSKMKKVGKTPSIYNRGGYAAGFPKWTTYEATDKDIDLWREQPDYGICIQTRYVRAFDIDIEDKDEAQAIVDTIQEMLGFELPLRYRENSSKCLLAFRLPGEFGKQVIKTKHGMIEILANGQQFIAAGTHPSGVRYEWSKEINEGIPEISQKQFDAIVFILEEEFAIAATTQRGLRKAADDGEVVTDDRVQYLEAQGHVLEYGPEGQAHIECPFADQHTTESAISSTSYFPAGGRGYEQGHFFCLHAHCDERTDAEFEDAFGYRLAQFDDISHLEEDAQRFEVIPVHTFAGKLSPSWIIKGILPEEGIGMIFGASSSGKSFFAIDLICSIARGVDWNGYKTQQGKVVYIAAEGAAGIRKRFKVYALHHSIRLEDLPVGVVDDSPNLYENDTDKLIKAIKKFKGVKIIVIDTLAQVTAGSDENSGHDMGKILNRCNKIQQETGAVVILIHHSGKDKSKGARGWSGVIAAMDFAIEVQSTASRKATLKKQKDGEDGLTFPFTLIPKVLELDEDGEEVTSCVVEYNNSGELIPELRGKWPKLVFKAAQEIESMFGEGFTPVETVVSRAIKDQPYDPGDDPEKLKRDSRRDCAQRALSKVVGLGLLIIEDNKVGFPQKRKASQSIKCGGAV